VLVQVDNWLAVDRLEVVALADRQQQRREKRQYREHSHAVSVSRRQGWLAIDASVAA
jgi:hypothetical protein